jgi:plasmid stability protein
MAKMIQIRNVPDDLHRKLKSRAAEQGMSLSDYLLAEVEVLGTRPSPEEIKERLGRLAPVKLSEDPSVTLRRMRDAQG